MRKQWVLLNVAGVLCLPLLLRAQATYTITTFAGNGSAGYLGDGGTAAGSQFASPFGAAFAAGSLYIADQANNRIRKIAADGSLSTVAGNGNPGYAGDAKGATSAQVNFPSALALDSGGNLYIADTNNYVIRKVASGGTITTFAGVNSQGPGWGGDGGAATLATLGRPTGLAVNSAGDLLIADTSNNLVRRVSGANITTWAGNGVASFAGDGNKATSGALNNPEGLALDAAGNLYIADTSNNVIRKVTSDGIISTVAGNRTAGFAGDGGLATRASLNNPKGVAIDAAGNLFIADSLNSRIRQVTPDGIITTIAGNGRQGYTGDGGPASSATLRFPSAVTLGAGGTIYVVDNQNNTIRLLTPVAVAAPAIRANGVNSASDFGGFTSVAPGSWIEIYGSNLAAHSRLWTGADFNGSNAPTSLDGTKVTIGGQAAVIDYISDSQINGQVPPNVATGTQQITVTTAGGSSAPYAIAVNPTQPGLYAPALLSVGGNQYAGAVFSDNVTYALPAGAVAGIASRPARPGDQISIAGVGFGAVTPSAQPGQVVQQSNSLVAPFQIFIGGAPAALTYWGLAPNAIGAYQFNLTVPSVAAGDAVPLTFTLDGVPGTQTLYIAVQN